MLLLLWMQEQRCSSPWAADSNLFTHFSNRETTHKKYRYPWYFKGLSPAKQAGVQHGDHWHGEGGLGAGSARHRPMGWLAPQSWSCPVLLALVSVLLLWVKKESCFQLI